MSVHPFAGLNPKPSPWGYNWTPEMNAKPSFPDPMKPKDTPTQTANHYQSVSPEPQMLANQYANMPAALINTLKREKKPFTYTPGGVNLSEVLNARLQKRMERKKKYSQEKMAEEALPKFDPHKQVIVMSTYNSPLDMYSMENAIEALEVQAELVAADKSLSAPSRSATLPRNHTFRFDDKDMDPGRGVAQSKAFRVLQIITDTEEDPTMDKDRHQFRDEMRFTGLRDSKAIPSKFFHTLQKITGTEDDEEEEPQHREMHKNAPTHSAAFEKETTATRPPFMPQQNLPQFTNDGRGTPEQQFGNNSALKRPAAFLPIKTTPGFRPVQPPFLSNGPVRRVGNVPAGTDF